MGVFYFQSSCIAPFSQWFSLRSLFLIGTVRQDGDEESKKKTCHWKMLIAFSLISTFLFFFHLLRLEMSLSKQFIFSYPDLHLAQWTTSSTECTWPLLWADRNRAARPVPCLEALSACSTCSHLKGKDLWLKVPGKQGWDAVSFWLRQSLICFANHHINTVV